MYRTRAQHTPLCRTLVLVGRLAVLALSGLLLSTSQRPEGALPAWRSAQQGTTRRAATVVPPAPEVTPMQQRQIRGAYGKLPLRFEANAGQTDPQVQFLVRGSGSTLFLTATEAVLAVRGPEGTAPVRMQLVGANLTPHVRGVEELPGTSNYFIGNDPQQWRTAVPSYAKVVYDGIYPGVDLVYYGTQGGVEHDFVVAPGTTPSVIAFDIHGADQVAIDAQGDLVVATRAGDVRLRKPVLYQEMEGQRQAIAGGYMLTAEHRVGFQVGTYDTTRPLVIDPVLVYATYLGGSGDDFGFGIAVDAGGQAYVTGTTTSLDFPVAGNPLQATFGGGADAFVAKLNPAGTALIYATYLGGSGGDEGGGGGIAVDAGGQAYVTGTTTSLDFPIAGNPFQPLYGGGDFDAFVAKLNPAGTALVYATYLGGTERDSGFGIAVDAGGQAYVTGTTTSLDFPVAGNPLQATFGGGADAFVAKLNPAGTALIYATYLGGSGGDSGFGIAVDAGGQAYVTGTTTSLDFPIAGNPFQPLYGGGDFDAFVAKLNPAGTALVYATYLGGSAVDADNAITVDAAGQAYVTGGTASLDFPVAGNPLQPLYGGGDFDAFVAKLNPAGTALVYATYLGGSGSEEGNGIAVDAVGQVHVMGGTDSSDFPVAGNPFQPLYGGNIDAFVAKLNPAGTALAYATYLGGSGEDYGFGIVVDAVGQVYVTGWAASPDFPIAGNPFQPLYGGNTDAFVAKIVPDTLPPEISIIATPETLWPPNGRTVSVTIVATITDAGSGVDPNTTIYAVEDEYGSVEPSGSLTLGADSRYTATIPLQASRNGNDQDGRLYTITVSAQDMEGNIGSTDTIVTAPQNQGQGQGIPAR